MFGMSSQKQGVAKKAKKARVAALEAAVLRIEARLAETPQQGGQKERKRKRVPPPATEAEMPEDSGQVISSDDEEEAKAGPAAKRSC
uniref:Uncharacterized protein n=1 Tax=Romanomermis culicivorax TaxID=13658 RepID=A0A915JCU2_ROMCU